MGYAMWANSGKASLLPRADRIAFVFAKWDTALVPWNTAVEIVGDLLRPEPDLIPDRLQDRGLSRCGDGEATPGRRGALTAYFASGNEFTSCSMGGSVLR
jgi:hypothetical protein